MKLKHIFIPCTKINSKWLKGLNVWQYIITILEGKRGKPFSNINHTDVFLGLSPKIVEIKAKINQLDIIKLTRFCTAKETILKKKTQPMKWEKILSNDETDKGLISKIYKQIIQLNSKKTTC